MYLIVLFYSIGPIVQRTKPFSIAKPASACISLMIPFIGDLRAFSIFMASSTNMTSPFFTVWPIVTLIAFNNPGMGAFTFTMETEVSAPDLMIKPYSYCRESLTFAQYVYPFSEMSIPCCVFVAITTYLSPED